MRRILPSPRLDAPVTQIALSTGINLAEKKQQRYNRAKLVSNRDIYIFSDVRSVILIRVPSFRILDRTESLTGTCFAWFRAAESSCN